MSAGASESGRWPADALARRRALEMRKRRKDEHDEARSPKRLLNGYHYVSAILKLTGLYSCGRRMYMNPSLNECVIETPTLPAAFDGLRILHLSDLHFDLEPELAKVAAGLLKGLDYDVCVVTGDFRDRLTHGGDSGVKLAVDMLAGCGRPVYACLGNHDLYSDAETLEKGGICVLVNENASFERDGSRLYFCGVDDPGYYRTDDFARAYEGVPEGAFSIVLAHDPGAYRKAAATGAALMLCGHTHGGQMCLPGGYALSTHSDCLRGMVSGLWQYGNMAGYTSSGVGGSRVPARFFTRGEVVIHTLRKAAR
jgi:uncharacterized protein